MLARPHAAVHPSWYSAAKLPGFLRAFRGRCAPPVIGHVVEFEQRCWVVFHFHLSSWHWPWSCTSWTKGRPCFFQPGSHVRGPNSAPAIDWLSSRRPVWVRVLYVGTNNFPACTSFYSINVLSADEGAPHVSMSFGFMTRTYTIDT